LNIIIAALPPCAILDLLFEQEKSFCAFRTVFLQICEFDFCMIANQLSSFCSVWSATSETNGPGQLFFAQPDGIDVAARNDTKRTEYGRIVIDFHQVPHAGEPTGSHTRNGSAVSNYDPLHVRVTDEEVFLNIKLSGKHSVLTLHAVRRIQIESHDKAVTSVLTPMQPNLQRSKPVQQDVNGLFAASPKPVDFSCTEIDLSFMTNGTASVR
jgi:hypothetical protein